MVIVVSDEGVIRGVTNRDRVPLSAVLRIDAAATATADGGLTATTGCCSTRQR